MWGSARRVAKPTYFCPSSYFSNGVSNAAFNLIQFGLRSVSGKLFHSRSAYHVALLRFPRNPDVSTTYPAKKQHLELSEEEPLLHQHGGSLSNSFCPRGPVAIVFYFAQLGLYEDAPVLPWYFPKNTED